MAKDKPSGATRCGSYCYLFKSSTNSSDCLISAHGGFVAENRSFTVPSGVSVLFYGEHGAALNDPNISSFSRDINRAQVVETCGPGDDCRNYLLSKYQGAHAGSSGTEVVETYEQVAGAGGMRDKVRKAQFEKLLGSKDEQATQRIFEKLLETWGGSILTIRNRWNVLFGVPLNDAIKAARKEMPSLRNFHCVFCRCYMLPESLGKKLGVTIKPSVDVRYKP